MNDLIIQMQQWCDEKTGGLIRTRKEIIYILTIFTLVAILVFSLIMRTSA